MHFTIPANTEDNHGNTTSGDAHFSAPDGTINIILDEPGLEISFDAKPLIQAIKNSLLDELGLL
jgi:hypothetical protein